MKKILKTENLTKYYNKLGNEVKVLEKINFYINKGEIVILMGPSGSGKTTLLNILGTLDTNYIGKIWFDGDFINPKLDLSDLRAKKLGFVFQFHHLLPEFNLYENLELPNIIGDIKYTKNMNGTFINLSILDEELINLFYNYIYKNLKNIINIERENTLFKLKNIKNEKNKEIVKNKIYKKKENLTELEIKIIELSKIIGFDLI